MSEPSPSRSWYTVGVLGLAYTISYIDRQVISLLIGPIREDLQISDTEISLLYGVAFGVLYALLGLPLGWLADRTNRRNLISVGIAAWSAMTMLCGKANSFGGLFLARVGVGVGEAALSPAAYSLIADLFPRERLGRALGTYSSGVYVGIGLAFLFGGALITLFEGIGDIDLGVLGTFKPWQATFFAVGAPGLLVALLVLTLTEPNRSVKAQEGGATVQETIRYLTRNAKTYGLHFFGFSMLALLFNGLMFWAVEYFVRVHEMAKIDIGRILGLEVLVFGGAGVICGGLLADWFSKRGRKDAPILAGLVGAMTLTPLTIVAVLVPDATFSLLLFCPVLFFASFPFGPAAAAIQMISPHTMRSQISAVYLFIITMGGIGFGATAIALVTDHVFGDDNALHYAIAIVTAIAGSVSVLLLSMARKPFAAHLVADEALE